MRSRTAVECRRFSVSKKCEKYDGLRDGRKLMVEAINACFQLQHVEGREIESGEFDVRHMLVNGPGYRERCYVPTEIESRELVYKAREPEY
ncbi:MAG: hypothetical protein JW852_08075 [Spirochaetales bacterium]|nr:hypothetical protein [Spirochaetales bacterium]